MTPPDIYKMNDTISLTEALKIIDRQDKTGGSIPFDITFRSLQRNSKTGGKLYTYNQVKKYRKKKYEHSTAAMINAVSSGAFETKNPNHFANRTQNLEMQNGEIKKIHIRLMISINGKTIIY